MKLLYFHKFLSQIATNLLGAFIPLIIFQYTGKLIYAFLYYIAQKLLTLLVTLVFKKWIVKYPQIFLLIRAIPVLLYSISVILLDFNIIVAVVGITIFESFSNAFNFLPKEIIYNYSLLQTSEKSQSFSLLFEEFGEIASFIIGGLFLQYINGWGLAILSLSIYLLSVIPLFMYYIKYRKQKTFNNEGISNFAMVLNEKEDKSKQAQQLGKRLKLSYFILYLFYNSLGAMYVFLQILMFVRDGDYSLIGYLLALFSLGQAITFYIYPKISQNFDTTILISILFVIISVTTIIIPFIHSTWLMFVVFAINGISDACCMVFVADKMKTKGKILGITNDLCVVSTVSMNLGMSLPGFVSLITPIYPIATFVFMGLCGIFVSIFTPINEKKNVKKLLDYLQK